jgi:hypothetical protein
VGWEVEDRGKMEDGIIEFVTCYLGSDKFKLTMKSKAKYIKKKVIEATVIFSNPTALMRVVFLADTIDELILDMQEAYPDRGISRVSIATWKFVTIEDAKRLNLPIKGNKLVLDEAPSLFNRLDADERSVARDAESGNKR